MKKILFAALVIIFASCGTESPDENDEIPPTDIYYEGIGAETVNDSPPEYIPAPFDPSAPPEGGVAINLTAPPAPQESPWANASDMVAAMRIGWNLGNTLDAHNPARMHDPINIHETIWNNPVTTRENIETIAEAGFDVLRVPVTWYPRLLADCPHHTIRTDWMERVEAVVNYGLDAGMFVILNTHHDESLFSLFDDGREEAVAVISRLWEQIAYVFRDYPHKLIFEGLNEPRTIGSPREWTGGTPEERYNVNILNQTFVNTVRESGGNNLNRMLMVPTYAAATTNFPIREFVLPQDPWNDENKLIVSLHMYAPYHFALTLSEEMQHDWSPDVTGDTAPIINGLDLAYRHFVSQGVPVIMGEMGALNRDNLEARTAWTYFYVREAAERGILCIWWDNGRFGTSLRPADGDHFAIFDRRTNTFLFPEIVDALMRATQVQ